MSYSYLNWLEDECTNPNGLPHEALVAMVGEDAVFFMYDYLEDRYFGMYRFEEGYEERTGSDMEIDESDPF